jgi:hypothetical protein
MRATQSDPTPPRKRGAQPGNSNARVHGRDASRRPKRKSGGQPGNGNALRHGFYSQFFSQAEMSGLDSDVKGEFLDEISLARITARKLAALLEDYEALPLQDVLAIAHGLSNYLDRIQSLTRAQRFIYNNMTTIEQALEELKDIPPEVD